VSEKLLEQPPRPRPARETALGVALYGSTAGAGCPAHLSARCGLGLSHDGKTADGASQSDHRDALREERQQPLSGLQLQRVRRSG